MDETRLKKLEDRVAILEAKNNEVMSEQQILDTEITCSSCGEKDTVPFHPTPGYPVYCKKCYSARGGQHGR